MTIVTARTIKLNPVWPKYWMVCGDVIRILTDQEAPERLIGSQWHPDQG
jgi:hypothetical protein